MTSTGTGTTSVRDHDHRVDRQGSPPRASTDGTRPPVVRTVAVAIVLAVLLAAVVWTGVLWWNDRSAESERTAALQAATAMAVNLTSINGETAQQDVQKVIDGSTGSFGDLFRQNLDSYTGMVRDAKVTSTGEVTAAAVQSAGDGGAEILVAASGKVRNAAAPEDQDRQYRMKIDMVKEGDRWLVAELSFIG